MLCLRKAHMSSDIRQVYMCSTLLRARQRFVSCRVKVLRWSGCVWCGDDLATGSDAERATRHANLTLEPDMCLHVRWYVTAWTKDLVFYQSWAKGIAKSRSEVSESPTSLVINTTVTTTLCDVYEAQTPAITNLRTKSAHCEDI